MHFRILAALAAVMLVCVPAAAGTKIDNPVTFVRATYERLAKDQDYSPPEDIYTPHLAGLFALEKKESGGDVGRMDFEFWTNAQDWSIKDVNVSGVSVEGSKDREIVTAKFKNIDSKEEIHFYFEKAKAGWQLDDARSFTGRSWTLSLILKYGEE
jgi:hypothetical protein